MRSRTTAGASVLTMSLLVGLTGCFMIPLADGRSPFDDPFGVSNSQLAAAVPEVSAALDGIDTDHGWELSATGAASNCEGDCKLHLSVKISPKTEFVVEQITEALARDEVAGTPGASFEHDDNQPASLILEVPDELWLEAATAAVTVAERHRIDVSLISYFSGTVEIAGEKYQASPNECPAVWSALRNIDPQPGTVEAEEKYEVLGEREGNSCSVQFFSRKARGLAEELAREQSPGYPGR